MKTTDYSFGSTAAIVTSTALITGLGDAAVDRATVISGLLIVALADNLTDSISIHVYQEAERLEKRRAFRTTLANFGFRVVVALTFVCIVAFLPPAAAAPVAAFWGLLLLVALTTILARERGVPVGPEIAKHVAAATATVILGYLIGRLIHGM